MFILAKRIKNNFFKFKRSDGFSLVELLVSISIITLMSTLFLTNYHSTNERSALILAAQKLSSDVRIAQNKSLGSSEYGDDNIPTGGWGVHIEEGGENYTIFADDNGNYTFDIGEDNISDGAEFLKFPPNVTIKEINVNSLEVASLDVVFLPPNPVTFINGIGGASAEIILTESASLSTSIIEINYFGLIDNI